jgi:hypothetical protein
MPPIIHLLVRPTQRLNAFRLPIQIYAAVSLINNLGRLHTKQCLYQTRGYHARNYTDLQAQLVTFVTTFATPLLPLHVPKKGSLNIPQ